VAHIAGIRYTKGLGGAAVYLRARDATAQYWDWTALAWSATETAACKQALAERQDSDAAESRYMASVALPPGVQSILEYVLASTAEVLGEEQTVPQAVIEVAGTIPSAPDPEMCAVYEYLRRQDGSLGVGDQGSATIASLPADFAGSLFRGQEVRASADAGGIIQWALPRGASVRFVIAAYGVDREIVVPAQASARLSDIA
jgi:hypothetical protein